jgi:hypothetical protein
LAIGFLLGATIYIIVKVSNELINRRNMKGASSFWNEQIASEQKGIQKPACGVSGMSAGIKLMWHCVLFGVIGTHAQSSRGLESRSIADTAEAYRKPLTF